MRLAVVLGALLLGSSAARADLATGNVGTGEWGHVTVALTGTGEFTKLVFALYSSGRVLYLDGIDNYSSNNYNVVALTADEVKALVGDLGLERVGALHPPNVDGNDGVTECIFVWSRGARQHDCMWGGIERKQPAGLRNAPPPMQKIWKRLAYFTSPRARPWVADRITVTASPYPAWTCATATPAPWPAEWPRPPRTAPGRDRRWSFTLSDTSFASSYYDTSHGCLLVDGERYSLTMRRTLPDDDFWLR
jgi:hypothetical protein